MITAEWSKPVEQTVTITMPKSAADKLYALLTNVAGCRVIYDLSRALNYPDDANTFDDHFKILKEDNGYLYVQDKESL